MTHPKAAGKTLRLIPSPAAVMKFAGRLTGKSETVDRLDWFTDNRQLKDTLRAWMEAALYDGAAD